MDGQNIYTVNGTPIPRKEEYIFWSTRMESHMKALGHWVKDSVQDATAMRLQSSAEGGSNILVEQDTSSV